MKPSLKQFVYTQLDSGADHLSDSEIFKFRQRVGDIITASDHVRNWKRRQASRDFLADKEIVELHKYRKNYSARLKGEDGFYNINKDHYNEIKQQFEKDNSRPDLTESETYKKKDIIEIPIIGEVRDKKVIYYNAKKDI